MATTNWPTFRRAAVQLGDGQVLGGDPEHRGVQPRVGAGDGRGEAPAVREGHLHLDAAPHHVLVGEDAAVGVEDDAASAARLVSTLTTAGPTRSAALLTAWE